MQRSNERPVDLVRARLEDRGLKTIGRGDDFMAQCPVPSHGRGRGDVNPSLHVSVGTYDRALLHCHVGCATEQVVEALGLSFEDLHPRWADDAADKGRRTLAKVDRGAERTSRGQGVKGQGQRQNVTPVDGGVGSSTTGGSSPETKVAGDAMDERLDRFRAGLLEPEPVALPIERLPRQAKALRALVAEVELWMGLRLADFDYRPIPLSQRFVARRMGWLRANGEPDDARGWKALRTLVERGVLVPAEPLPSRGGWPGTLTFLPPDELAAALGFASASDDAVDGEPVLVEAAVAQPGVEVAEEPSVNGAEVAAGQDPGVIAVGLKAAARHGVLASGHEAHGTSASGRGSRCAVSDE